MCAGDSAEAVDILMTELPNKRVIVDESRLTAKVDAGMVVKDFLDQLSRTGRGYTLGNFPWFTFQTVGGAVATGSHGSSLTYGSLSSDDMLLSLDVVLANGACAHMWAGGTRHVLTALICGTSGTLVQMSKSSHPFLWTAMQVSVGRLGVITAVTFKILPNAPMQRYKVDVGVDTFLATMKRVQDGYNRAGDAAPEGTSSLLLI